MSIKRNLKEEALKNWINKISATEYGSNIFECGEFNGLNIVTIFETARVKDLELMLRLLRTAYHSGCEDTRKLDE